ncbi:hypothetical protein DRE_00296 [Drechslerella stenobrocha 248]|uniref:Thiamine-binding protein domain-containing protein n=1 Tax=Drechslerella stenobrocha 248 TaxID=1043628 RepID=W7I564_9PEZI|nr:hypothetical protein DRE_00296 [Drechslerella stenobrocha 248]
MAALPPVEAPHTEDISSGQAGGLATPAHVTADFCLIPIGTPTASVSQYIASVQKLLATSGVKYSMHSAGTTLEGTWDEGTFPYRYLALHLARR